MKGPGGRILSATMMAVAAAPLVACALDFDRYTPLEKAADSSAIDGPLTPEDVSLGEMSRADAPSDDAPVDVPTPEAAGPCSAPPSCFMQATACGMACGQNYQSCLRPCGDADNMCTQSCTSMRQSCLGRCATTCIGCTQDGGCSATTACLDATHP